MQNPALINWYVDITNCGHNNSGVITGFGDYKWGLQGDECEIYLW
jgi:hypothetical protein